ncbi:MAG: DMT family transporter [Candidatus Buchananbacteria bacterium]
MNWFLLSIISVITLAVANLLQRVLMRDDKSDVFAYSITFQLTCGFLIAIFAWVRGFVLPPIQELWPIFSLTMILYAAGTLLLFRALQIVEVSKVTILTSSRALWTIIIALIFFGESFNFLKIFGVLLILSSVALISFNQKAFCFNSGVVYALGAAFCYGIGFANDTFILRQADAISYAVLSFLLPGLLMLLVRPRVVRGLKSILVPTVLWKMILMGLFYATSTITIYLAYQTGGTASQLAPINQSVVIFTVLLAAIFLGERNQLGKKFIGAMLAVVGVLLLR